jgi:hypothetical protein
MKVWPTGTYPGGKIKLYCVAYAGRCCLGINVTRALTVQNINLTVDMTPVVAVCNLHVAGIYITKNHRSTLEILAPTGGDI